MGGDKQVITLALNVDLQCSKCYRKIKRVLCQFPQVRDQEYNEKTNTVTIKVVCCSPDCIKKKIISKAGNTVKGFEEIKPQRLPPPPPPGSPKKPPRGPEPPPPVEPQRPDRGPPPPPPEEPQKPVRGPPPPPPEEPQKPKPKPNETQKPTPTPTPAPAPAPAPVAKPYVQGYPYPPFVRSFFPEGHEGPSCVYGQVAVGPPCYHYEGYHGRPIHDSYGGGSGSGRGYQPNPRYDYFSEENTGGCAIM